MELRAVIKPLPAFLPDDPLEAVVQALLGAILAGDMHPALDSDIWVCDGSGKELAESTQVKSVLGCYSPPLLNHVLQLFEEGVLQDRVDHQDESREHAGEERLGAFLLEDIPHCLYGGLGLLGWGPRETCLLRLRLAGRHAGIHDPDRVSDHDCGAACECTRDYGFHRGEFLRCPASFDGGLLESGAAPFVPVVVDEVGNADPEESRVQPRIQTVDALPLHDATDSIDGARLRTL